MYHRGKGRARTALNQQLEIFGDDQVSLHSLWRAWGSPTKLDPQTWSEQAAPLLEGLAGYRANVDRDAPDPGDSSPLLWTWQDESKDPWLTGDLMSHEFVAWAYASFLDTRLGKKMNGANRLVRLP
jgi:hypothetical protein